MPRVSNPVAFLAALAFVVAGSGPALAAGVCDCSKDCPEAKSPMEGLAFDDKSHVDWYAGRFWRGTCSARLFWCFSGDDWFDLMQDVLQRAPAADAGQTCQRLFTLGRRIGHEWARDNDVRAINTDDLKAWRAVLLSKSRAPAAAINDIEALVAERLPGGG